jgi:hypothetical protein
MPSSTSKAQSKKSSLAQQNLLGEHFLEIKQEQLEDAEVAFGGHMELPDIKLEVDAFLESQEHSESKRKSQKKVQKKKKKSAKKCECRSFRFS